MATLAASIGRGTLAARPATMPAGSLYFVTDTSTMYRSNGATWDSVEASATAVGAAPTVHTHAGADVTDFAEVADDRIASLLVAGSGITLTYNDAAGTLTIAASSGSGPVPGVLPGWISGRWYSALETIAWTAVANSAMAANRLSVSPLAVPAGHAIDRIGINVTTLASSALIRLGIYSPAADGAPGTLLQDCGTVDASTTGNKEITISRTLPAGWYWLASVSGHAPAVSSMSSTSGPNYIGQTAQSASNRYNYWEKTDATAITALPGSFPFSGANGSPTGPLVMVRAT